MRLLAGVPSVIYGLIGILAVAPWINNHLISNARKHSVAYVVQLSGADLMTATLILTVMILPIMVAITATALESVPVSWREGSVALGVNRWRTIWRVSVRTARPAIAAALVLATARALGEAIMLAMVSGGRPFDANPLDGITFLFEPVQPLAPTIIQNFAGQSSGPIAQHDLRDRRRPAGVRGAAVVRGLGRQATVEALRDQASDARRPRSPRGPSAPTIRHRPRERTSSWPLADRLCYWLCWAAGIGMCVVAVAIVLYMLVKGLSYLRPSLLVTSPAPSPRAEPERRLPGPDRGHAARDGDRHRRGSTGRGSARGLADGVPAPGMAGPGRSSRRWK